jgi:hypothetical protein
MRVRCPLFLGDFLVLDVGRGFGPTLGARPPRPHTLPLEEMPSILGVALESIDVEAKLFGGVAVVVFVDLESTTVSLVLFSPKRLARLVELTVLGLTLGNLGHDRNIGEIALEILRNIDAGGLVGHGIDGYAHGILNTADIVHNTRVEGNEWAESRTNNQRSGEQYTDGRRR